MPGDELFKKKKERAKQRKRAREREMGSRGATDSVSMTTNTFKHNNPSDSSPRTLFMARNGLVVSHKSRLSARLRPLCL